MRLILALFLFLFIPFQALAEDTPKAKEPVMHTITMAPKARYAIALHGTPKYPENFTHFDYVNPEAPKGGTLHLHQEGSYDSLNPFIIKGSPATGIGSLLYESLMEQSNDEPFTMYGRIAETIELPKDKSWVAFNIRPEARWHDGMPITAHDVVWTFNTLIEKGTPFYKAYYADVKKVEATSDSRVKFTFAHSGNAELPLIISQLTVLPRHYWEKEDHVFEETSLEPPLGSGPYKIEATASGRSITYTRVANWWGKDLPINKGRYNFDSIEYDYYRDSNVALEAFFAGEYDVRYEYVAKLWETGYNTPPVQDGRIIKEILPHKNPAGMQAFIYNIRRPVFQDINVRKALAYAFDFEWSNKQFAYGSYTRTKSFFENSDLASRGLPEGRELEILKAYEGKIPGSVFSEIYEPPKTNGTGQARSNLRKAMRILEDAGYTLGADGVRKHEKTGVRLEFEIIDSNPAFERWILPFVQNLERIGVKASFRIVDPAQYENRMKDFDFDMTVLVFPQSETPGNEQRDFWNSAKADLKGSRNYIGIKDPVVDTLIEGLIKAPSSEEHTAYCRALDRILLHNYYVIPQWHFAAWRIAHKKNIKRPQTLSKKSPGIETTWWSEPEQ